MLSLFHLGLMTLAVILVVMSISMREGFDSNAFDYSGRKDDQNAYLKTQDKYWDNRLFPQVVKGVDNESKFLALNKSKTKLDNISPASTTDKREIAKKIEKCRLINLTGECDEIEANSCGYCWDSDKILYGDATGPAADVCTKKNWIPPGPKVGYYCQKKKEQELCKTMKDCGDATGERTICAWCPLKSAGVPYKQGPNGGLVAKYDEDKCDWKSQLEGDSDEKKTSFLGWSPDKGGYPRRGKLNADGSMTPAPSPYGAPLDRGEGDCDADSDCGPGMKCGHDGRGVGGKLGVPGLKNPDGSAVTANAGYKDYCYDPNVKPKFEGNLIVPKDCERFNQLFPCVGPNMLTGPHSSVCLQSLWGKAGCSGDLSARVTDTTDYNNWNVHSYGAAKDNMRNSIRKVGLTSTNYSQAQSAYKKCFGKEVDSCEPRFKPRPQKCAQKIYDKSGCNAKGKLNPTFTAEWPTGYVGSDWKKGQEGDWTVDGYKSKVRDSKIKAQTNINYPKKNFDDTIKTNMQCYGEMPTIPWDKPCWLDFNIIMTSIDSITSNSSNGQLSFNNGPSGFKSLLTVSSHRGWWKNEYTWVGNYALTEEKYSGKYFPFWNFISAARNYWNNNWSVFKSKLLLVPSVGISNYNTLYFLNGSPFDNAAKTASNATEAISKGYFYNKDNNKYLTKEAFMHEKFPYYFFIRIARVN
jgi:hypothetical protein